MKGSNVVHIGNVAIGCISPEAKVLLDTIMEHWKQHVEAVRKYSPDYEPTPYGMAYWLVRWSGLIQPTQDDVD